MRCDMAKAVKTILMFIIILFITMLYGQKRSLTLVASFPDPESNKKDDFLAHPFDLVEYKDNYIVTDATECCLKVFSKRGDFIKKIGSKGHGPGELIDPFILTIDISSGNIYCIDQGNNRIVCFKKDGKYLNSIKTTLVLHDILFDNNRIYAVSYSAANNTFFSIYNTNGKLGRMFGKNVDDKIIDLKYGRYLYSSVSLTSYNGNIFAYYEYLPVVQVYDKYGNYLKKISLELRGGRKLYKDNMRSAKSSKNHRIMIRRWLDGVYAENDLFYCYSSLFAKTLFVFDKNGQVVREISFSSEISDGYRFIKKSGDKFIFVDIFNYQIKIFELRDRKL